MDKTSFKQKVKIRNALWENTSLIEKYVKENPDNLSNTEIQLIKQLKFIAEPHMKRVNSFIQKMRKIARDIPLTVPTRGEPEGEPEGLTWMCNIVRKIVQKQKGVNRIRRKDFIDYVSRNYPQRFGLAEPTQNLPPLKDILLSGRRKIIQDKSIVRHNIQAFLQKYDTAIEKVCNVKFI